MEEKRRAKRLELFGDIEIKEIGGLKDKKVDINITDCSTSGIGFSTTEQLTIGDNYEANLVIWNKEKLHVFLQIVRAVKEEDGYHYGSLFIGLPEDIKMRIQVYETVEDEKAKLS